MHLEVLRGKAKDIFAQLGVFRNFYLAGGTALALQIGHRVSVDFDLFSNEKITQQLLDQATKIFPKEKIKASVNNADELTIFIADIKVTFLHYPFPVLLQFIHLQGINALSPKEIAAIKAYTIGRRGSYKDYIDLYCLLSQNYVSLDEIIELAEKKYGDNFNTRLFLEQLVYLKDIEEAHIIFLKPQKVNKATLEDFFVQEIKKITLA